MGRDKSFLPWQGVPLWQHQLTLLRRLQPEELLCSTNNECLEVPGDVRVIPDRYPGLGPMAGLEALLASSSHDRVLVLAVDMPLVQPEQLQRLLDLSSPGTGALYQTTRGYEPLAAVYPKCFHAGLVDRLEHGRLALQEWINEVRQDGRVRLATLEDPKELRSLNSPEDLRGTGQS